MSWKSILGHEPAIHLLKGQLSQGRLSSPYLFVGLKGIGKRTVALEFAKEITQGSSLDVKSVCPESDRSQIGIDQVRELHRWMALTPYAGRWKVGILEAADSFTDEAAHASLRLLEEPPERSILISIATATHRLPATMVSRCHVVRFSPQGIDRVARFLKEAERLDPDLSSMLAAASGGRVGIALEFHRGERLAAKNAALDQVLKAWREGILEIPLGKASRPELKEALEWIAAWWRDLMVLALKGDPSWLIHQDRIADLKDVIASSGATVQRVPGLRPGTLLLEELLTRIERTYWAQEAIERNASPRIALASLLCR